MNRVRFIIVNIVETLLRVFPVPCKTGVITIGNPDKNSPVFLTCNYHLTVERVKRTLKKIDCYLLVANSRGINVWCGATGGHFTNHDVISILKVSGIDELVHHRNVILPQLAAAGVETNIIKKTTGWQVIWGPVYAKDIPLFLKNNFNKTPEMREVMFHWLQRIEMAVSWAFPISILFGLIMVTFWRQAVLPTILMVWVLSLIIFMFFPLYNHLLSAGGKRIGFVFFDFGRGGFQLFLWVVILAGLAIYSILFNDFTWEFMLRWGLVSFIVVLVLSIDLMGSTPIYKSGLSKERSWKVEIDKAKCRGAGICEQVCPRNCYEVDRKQHIATIPRQELCVRCGACIVQCPFDALYFVSPEGITILPEIIRKYKLNMMGKRLLPGLIKGDEL
jgi:NAD-dependent dihydropyrimidine dehydrogenase PreA subunit